MRLPFSLEVIGAWCLLQVSFSRNTKGSFVSKLSSLPHTYCHETACLQDTACRPGPSVACAEGIIMCVVLKPVGYDMWRSSANSNRGGASY